MQCFQKDPNLRVSARKLLKHPWIVNARRSDSVVPKKPTEYDEAVKSVQQWNEALKSPNAGSLRRTSRPMSSSPVPTRHDPLPIIATPAKGPSSSSLAKPRFTTEQFRSPDNVSHDNWDDDFTSAISPSALQLPHLRPHDNFGGLLSSEKLKAYASFETVTEETNWDHNFEGDLTMAGQPLRTDYDPLQTIRPYYPKHVDTAQVRDIGATSPQHQKKPSAGGRRAKAGYAAPPQKDEGLKQRTGVPLLTPKLEGLIEHRPKSIGVQYSKLCSTADKNKVPPHLAVRSYAGSSLTDRLRTAFHQLYIQCPT